MQYVELVVEKIQEVLGNEDADIALAFSYLALASYHFQWHDKAEILSIQLVWVKEKSLGQDNSSRLGVKVNFALLYTYTRNLRPTEVFSVDITRKEQIS